MTNSILLYNKGSATTAKALARLLNLTPRKEQGEQDQIKVRYGNSTPPTNTLQDTTLNSSTAIELVSDSARFSSWALEHGFNATQYIHKNDVNFDEITYPVLLRKKYHHGGLDIKVIQNREHFNTLKASGETNGYGYIVPIVHVDTEFRIHVLGNEAVKMFKKTGGELTDNIPVRSSYKGWHYERVGADSFPQGRRLAVDLLSQLGLSFGAVDLGFNRTENRYYIFEVNSAPGLNTETLQLYANFISNRME